MVKNNPEWNLLFITNVIPIIFRPLLQLVLYFNLLRLHVIFSCTYYINMNTFKNLCSKSSMVTIKTNSLIKC